MLGYFDGTVDQFHLKSGDPEEHYRIGQKVKSRVLYDVSLSTPPRFALSLADHVIKYTSKSSDANANLHEAYPVGIILDAVKVTRVESERGLVVEVGPKIQGFVHVSTCFFRHESPLTCALDLTNVRRAHPNPFSVIRRMEARDRPPSSCNWLLSARWDSSAIHAAFCTGAKVPAGC